MCVWFRLFHRQCVTLNDELQALLFSYPAWTRSDLPARYCAVFDEGYPTALLVIYLRKERKKRKKKKHIFETYHIPCVDDLSSSTEKRKQQKTSTMIKSAFHTHTHKHFKPHMLNNAPVNEQHTTFLFLFLW
jgi:hypothetical protein